MEAGALLAPAPLGREIFAMPELAAHLGSSVDASIVGHQIVTTLAR